MKTKDENNFPLRVVTKNLHSNPRCLHGPTILFIRQNKKFFACSAYRNRKDCNFFVTESDYKANGKVHHNKITENDLNKHQDLYNTYIMMKFCQENVRCYCHTCHLLFNSSKNNEHVDHDITKNLSLKSLFNPSKFLRPLDDNKREAQYLFSDRSRDTIINIIRKNRFKNIICIGTPRIHEYIKENYQEQNSIISILLDIDKRHFNFNGPHEFCRYNMFNNYFFDENNAKSVFYEFLKQSSKDDICIIIDPPFGGRIEPLANTLYEITSEYKRLKSINDVNMKLLSVIFVMPYFMEPYINNYISELKMSDYQVCYDNHDSFKSDTKQKIGSPVRFFTNINMENFILPTDEGYRFCKLCSKWIGKWNLHCVKCKDCTSKNGTTYKHCDICDRCVKSSWRHCDKCNRCALKEHTCGVLINNQKCFLCKHMGHKRIDCPQIEFSQK